MEKCCPGEHALTDTGESAEALVEKARERFVDKLAPALAAVTQDAADEGGKPSQDAQD